MGFFFIRDLFEPYFGILTIFSWILNYCRAINFYRKETFTIYIWCKYIGGHRITPPPVTKVTFLSSETLERVFEKNFLSKKCLFIVGQHFGNNFLLLQQKATKTTNVKKLGVVAFGRSNIKNEIWILQYILRKRVKYLARARALTPQNFAQKFRGMLIWAYFLKISNFCTLINFCRIETLVIWKSIYFWWKIRWNQI